MTRRLWRLVRFEWQKLLARRFALIGLLAVVAIAFLSPYAGKVVSDAQSLSEGRGPRSDADAFDANGWVSLATGMKWGLQIATYLVLLFAASSIAEESQLGTLKTILTRPVKRVELLFAKWLALCGYAAALLVLAALAAGVVGEMRFGFGNVVDPMYPDLVKTFRGDMVLFFVRALVLSLPGLFALVSLGLLFSCAIDHPGYAVGTAISSYVVLDVVASLSSRAARVLFAKDTLASVQYLLDIAQLFGEKKHFVEATPRLVLLPVASGLVFFAGAAWLLRTREVGE